MTDDQIDVSIEQGITIVRLGTEFSSIYESDLSRLGRLRDLAGSVDPAVIILDLTNARYFGSAFIGFLMAIAAKLNERDGGRLCLVNLTPFASVALETTRADAIMTIHANIEDALNDVH